MGFARAAILGLCVALLACLNARAEDAPGGTATLMRGIAAHQRGDYAAALQLYDAALASRQLSPDDLALLFANRGAAYRALGRDGLALADLDVAVDLAPDYVEARINRGNLHAARGEYALAIDDYDAALQQQPGRAEIFANRGRARFDAGNAAGAATDLATANALDSGDAYTVLWLHLARHRAGMSDAEEFARNAARLPEFGWPAPLLGFYAGTRSAAATLQAAASGDTRTDTANRCEADFYVGVLEAETDRLEGQRLLDLARQTCPPNFVEYAAAGAALRRLAQ